jgi:hypothetical protein
MMNLNTQKRRLYFDEVIRLHREKGYGERRVSRILPIGHATVSKWLAIFAAENDTTPFQVHEQEEQTRPTSGDAISGDIKALEREVARSRAQLKHEKSCADAHDEMITVAESRFKISIRKKAGVKR